MNDTVVVATSDDVSAFRATLAHPTNLGNVSVSADLARRILARIDGDKEHDTRQRALAVGIGVIASAAAGMTDALVLPPSQHRQMRVGAAIQSIEGALELLRKQALGQASTPKEQTARLLNEAAAQFRSYETSHRVKGTEDGNKKADVNRDWANKLAKFAERM